MNKSLGIVVGILVVILFIVLFWAFRGRPAGDQTGPFVASPVATLTPAATGDFPLVPAQTPITAPTQSGAQVSVAATGFSSASVTIPVGGTVTFTNVDTESHQIASNPHPVHTNFQALNIAVLAPGASGAVVFDRAGTFGYHDHLNPGLTGIVIVQ